MDLCDAAYLTSAKIRAGTLKDAGQSDVIIITGIIPYLYSAHKYSWCQAKTWRKSHAINCPKPFNSQTNYRIYETYSTKRYSSNRIKPSRHSDLFCTKGNSLHFRTNNGSFLDFLDIKCLVLGPF